MTVLTVYNVNEPNRPRRGEQSRDATTIKNQLAAIGVQFERWATDHALSDANPETILASYDTEIKQLSTVYGFQSVDVISLTPEHPDKTALRQKFLAEHIHDDFEVRFFIDGSGLFFLHVNDQVYALLCECGDLISVPANTPHWFDMGEAPNFKTIRFFTRTDGWVAQFTGSAIAETFPSFNEYMATLND